jgi:TRAP-type C4-dicarboxylate transport system permease small subunit
MNRLMIAIERALALAFIAAVCLNFANVVGRYGFGRSIAAADEIQIYIMVFMAFLGAAVVSWRRQHLRMDVLVRFFPPQMQSALRFFEIVLVVAVAGFALVQSWRYSAQMFALGRTSDVGGIPMWIPHGVVTLGLLLLLIASSLRSRR